MFTLKMRRIVTHETLIRSIVAILTDVDQQIEENDFQVSKRNFRQLCAILFQDEDESIENSFGVIFSRNCVAVRNKHRTCCRRFCRRCCGSSRSFRCCSFFGDRRCQRSDVDLLLILGQGLLDKGQRRLVGLR